LTVSDKKLGPGISRAFGLEPKNKRKPLKPKEKPPFVAPGQVAPELTARRCLGFFKHRDKKRGPGLPLILRGCGHAHRRTLKTAR
jgi:hypothetical protein